MNIYKYWGTIEGIIDDALDLQEEQQKSFIEKRCGHNTEMLNEALDYHTFIKKAEDLNFLDTEFNQVSELLEDPELSADLQIKNNVIGTKIGPHQITELIGEGGMGSVYLAERTDGEFDQKVAIKFLRGGFFSSYLRKRFINEKRILARLNHPNITRLLDGGIADNGTPYLTMEYVDGLPVDEYCKKKKLDVNARLKLFLQICEAVQFAHTKLIIHRDLKPQNILVTNDGQIKIMDFGIAKFVDPDSEVGEPLQTMEGHFVASFKFAAPEQIRSEDPTIATDVYGLGGLLYMLLTNEYPHQFDDHSITEIKAIIQNQAPVRPGKIGKSEIGPISSDVEAIILKALAKEPEQRYNSVEMMADDIKRYLNGLPVNARQSTIGYRTGKFMRRHRNKIAAAILLIVGFLGLIMYYTTQLAAERDIAQIEAERSEAINNFLVGMVTETDPYESPGEPVTVRTLLEQNVEEITTQFADQPEIALELLLIIGRGQTWLANRQQARATLNRGIELIEADDIELDPAFLGTYKYILSSTYSGTSERKEELLRQALVLLEDQPDKQLMRAGITKGLAHTAYVEGDYEHSIELVRSAIDNACEAEALEIEPGWCTTILRDAFYYLRGGGKHDEAMEAAERQYNLSMELFDDGHPNQAGAGQIYANALIYPPRPNEAIDVIHQSKEIVKTYDGPDNLRMLRLSTILALAESAKGNDHKAIEQLQWALNQAVDLADDAFNRAPQLNNMIDRMLNLERAEDARLAYEKFGYEDPERMSNHHQWGHQYNEFRREILIKTPEEVPQQRWLDVVERFEQNYDDWLPSLMAYALNHAVDRQDLDSARYWFDRINKLDHDMESVREMLLAMPRYRLAENDVEEAERAAEHARELFEEREENQGPRIARLYAIEAEIDCRLGEFTSGHEQLQKAEKEWNRAEGHPDGLLTLHEYSASCFDG